MPLDDGLDRPGEKKTVLHKCLKLKQDIEWEFFGTVSEECLEGSTSVGQRFIGPKDVRGGVVGHWHNIPAMQLINISLELVWVNRNTVN